MTRPNGEGGNRSETLSLNDMALVVLGYFLVVELRLGLDHEPGVEGHELVYVVSAEQGQHRGREFQLFLEFGEEGRI